MPYVDPSQQNGNGEPPESVIVDRFNGIKNTVAPERLEAADLEFARDIDLDDTGQASRRRGYALLKAGEWHSLQNVGALTFGVQAGMLGRIQDDFSFIPLMQVGSAKVSCTGVGSTTYFTCSSASGAITNDAVSPWGMTSGQGQWLSPVINPTAYLGQVAGKLLGDPPRATIIEAYHGRIYLAVDNLLWRTELYQYHSVDRTKGYYQFEQPITMVRAVDDGLFVGTTKGLYFLAEERLTLREFGALKLEKVVDGSVLPGSDVVVPVDAVRPGNMEQPTPTGTAIIFLTNSGIMAGFNSGETFNLTLGRVILPYGIGATALFRQDQGANRYVAAIDSAGGPSANARIGDYVDATIIRASQVGG